MCVSGRCHCGGLDLLALAEIQGKNEACPKLSSTSGFTVVHCTQWDIAGKILLVMVESPAFGKEGLEDLSRLDR